MKGMSLPINLVVIIAIAILVLLALAAFFASGFGGGTASISDAQALNKGCGIWKSRGCAGADSGGVYTELETITIPGYVDPSSGEQKSLGEACVAVLQDSEGSKCYEYCCTGQVGIQSS
jgi:hypothetical protein